MRASLFVYRDARDPWSRRLREAPQRTLIAATPGLEKLMGDFAAIGRIEIRPIGLYATAALDRARRRRLGNLAPCRQHRREQGLH